jgi:hypothetical protein
MADQPRFTYNPRSRRYHDNASGRFLSEKEVRQAVDVIIDAETVKVRDLSQRLVDGKINLAEWQNGMLAALKPLHVAMALSANGGLKNTSNSDLGYIGNLVKEQYKYLHNFVAEIKQGKQPLDGTLVARSALYTQAARSTHEAVRERAARAGGAQQEKSILGPADHCDACIEEAAKSWSPIGSLVPIGERTCKQNCRCTFTYR